MFQLDTIFLVPSLAVMLVSNPDIFRENNLSSVRTIVCRSAPLSAEVKQCLLNLLPNADIYVGEDLATINFVSFFVYDMQYGLSAGVYSS